MKNRKVKVVFILKRLIACLLAVVLILILPGVVIVKDNGNLFYDVFVGKKSKYQGIIEIWNIDTFESGTKSKTAMLLDIANSFQKNNKGLYVMIRSVTENECVNLLKDGNLPDLFSCSYGVAEKIKDYIMPIESTNTNVHQNLINAGMIGDRLMALPWCFGSYFLITTQSNLEKSGNYQENVSLIDIALNSGYEVVGKKQTKTIYSLGFGMGKYLIPQKALASYYNTGVLNTNNLSYNKELIQESSYSAYCRFVAGESVMLLGTQRDVIRMENRQQQGKIENLIVNPLLTFSDLVQFMMISKSDDEVKNEYKTKFIEFLLDEKMQEKVIKSGMYSVIKQGTMQHITPEDIANYSTNNVFIDSAEIKRLQSVIF